MIAFYVHRYLRMTPAMLAVIAFSTTILQYLGEGPTWINSITMFNSWCKKNWWVTSLYIHNFVDMSNMVCSVWMKEKLELIFNWFAIDQLFQCLSHTWYSAVDMQFYFISPMILIPLYKRPKFGVGIILTMLTGSMIITGYLTASRHYPAVPYFNDIV